MPLLKCCVLLKICYICLHKDTQKEKDMYTTDSEGKLNNYAIEPTVYAATYPSIEEQQQYVLQGAIAALLVVFLVLTSFAVS